jgi:hypothetical protein
MPHIDKNGKVQPGPSKSWWRDRYLAACKAERVGPSSQEPEKPWVPWDEVVLVK